MKFIPVFILAFGLSMVLEAQTPKFRVISIPVEKNGSNMREPWLGGVDAPQFSQADLDHDGTKDLFVFDRVGNKVLTYLSNGDGSDTMYSYSPKYEELFPTGLLNWALMRDYNHDGVPDLFTYGPSGTGPGTRVFKGSIQNNQLHFDLVCPIINFASPPFPNTVIYTNPGDIPVFTDVNRDGDLDILTYNKFGSTIAYYENQTMEHPGDPHYAADSFQYLQITTCWGNVSQDTTILYC